MFAVLIMAGNVAFSKEMSTGILGPVHYYGRNKILNGHVSGQDRPQSLPTHWLQSTASG
jgi:hypothetical protein